MQLDRLIQATRMHNGRPPPAPMGTARSESARDQARSSNSPSFAPPRKARSLARLVRMTTSGLSLSRSRISPPYSASSRQLLPSAFDDFDDFLHWISIVLTPSYL